MVAECPPEATSTTPQVTDIRIRWNTARSILEHRQPSEEGCLLAARALLGDDVIEESGAKTCEARSAIYGDCGRPARVIHETACQCREPSIRAFCGEHRDANLSGRMKCRDCQSYGRILDERGIA